MVNKDVAQLFLTEEALNKATHKKFTSSTFYRPGAAVYEYNFGDQRTFEESIAQAKTENDLIVDIDNKESTSIFDALLGFLPFIILIYQWVFRELFLLLSC